MTESDEQPLLIAEPASKKAPARRKAPAKAAPTLDARAVETAAAPPRAKASRRKAVDPESGDGTLIDVAATAVAPKPRVRKAAPRKAVAPDSTNGSGKKADPAPVEAEAPAPPPAPAPASPRAPALAPIATMGGVVEEWAPSRPAAAPAPAPVPAAAPPPASPEPGMARRYPVYVPRHVAKQLEEQGQVAPLAVTAEQAATLPMGPDPAGRLETRESREPRERRDDREPREPRERRDTRDPRDHREFRDRRQPQQEDSREMGYDPTPLPPPREDELGSAEGIIEISGKGFGFIRDPKKNYSQHPADVFVTPEMVRRYNLRDGQLVKGQTRRGGRGSQLHLLQEINADDPEKSVALPAFDELTVINPMERFRLETVPERYTTRTIDLMCPIGKGQRGLIVAPPRTGKTTLLQHIADAVVKNHPDVMLIMLLVDERPEEVTEIKRTIPSAEIMASSNDMDVKSHTRIAQLAIERAKRLAEAGHDVFVLLDSITRVGRAFNNATAGNGRTMSGGVDARALEIPRRLFSAARNTEEAGSITIVATALIDTGSRMDDLIFQEFKGTGNMELVLDRKIADQRIYPAVDIFQSGTRREELLVPADDLQKIAVIRRGLSGHKPIEAMERLLFFMKKFPTNSQMLREIPG